MAAAPQPPPVDVDPAEQDQPAIGGAVRPSRPTLRQAWAGGRWRRRLGRWAIAFVILVLLANGVVRLVERNTAPTADEIATLAAAKLGQTGFPTMAAEAFAARFAMVYMSWDHKAPDWRKQVLANYVADAVLQGPAGQQVGWDGAGKQWAYIAVPAGVQVHDQQHAIVTVAVLVDDGSWKYLEVPVFTDGTGALVVTARPAYVEAPTRATPADPPPPLDVDATAAAQLTELLPGFFDAYAKSQTEQLTYLVPTGSRIRGLGNAVQFDSLGQVTVPSGGSQRVATADVTWTVKMPGGTAKLTQTYDLTVVRTQDRWYVERVQASRTA
jgi:Conjugative transposon protein TcpC